MKDSDPRRRPDLMGGPDEPDDVMEGGEEPAGDRPDVMEPGESEEDEDVLDRGKR